jgi:thiol-disulfide isomerase/thioredoxin
MALLSCNDWENPVQLPNTNNTSSKRVIVLEDFTGASCPNCPPAASIIESLLDKYPNNLVFIGIHSRFLAQPATSGDVDMRTPEAESIEKFLGAWLGKPEAAINRKKFENQANIRVGKPDTWSSFIDTELGIAPEVDVKISKLYDETGRVLTVNIEVKGLNAVNKPIHLHVGITESDIVADQASTSGKITNYVNNHVLRKLFTPIEGEFIANSIAKDQSIFKEYVYSLPQDAVVWKAENCSVFAYVSLDAAEKYILQAAEIKVK